MTKMADLSSQFALFARMDSTRKCVQAKLLFLLGLTLAAKKKKKKKRSDHTLGATNYLGLVSFGKKVSWFKPGHAPE